MGKIVVIGAGIIGASTAYLLKNTYPNLDVTIIAKSFSPNTTSDGAAGLWQPLLPGKTPEHLVKYATIRYFVHIVYYVFCLRCY